MRGRKRAVSGEVGTPPVPDPFHNLPFDHPREECGVVGVFAPGEEASRLAFFGLFALQHRGQESAGVAATNARR